MSRLSPHFTLSELSVTSTGLPNTPGADEYARLRYLSVFVLEPLRRIWGDLPVRVTSGFRSPEVNVAVGGSRTSDHMTGAAADLIPPIERFEAMRRAVAELRPDGLLRDVDQLIVYAVKPHIHVGARLDRKRRQALIIDATGRPAKWA